MYKETIFMVKLFRRYISNLSSCSSVKINRKLYFGLSRGKDRSIFDSLNEYVPVGYRSQLIISVLKHIRLLIYKV